MAKRIDSTVRKIAKNRAQKDDPGLPRRGWTIGGGDVPDMWPRKLPRKVRASALEHAMPGIVGHATELMDVTQALHWIEMVASVDDASRTVTRGIALRELWRVTQALDQCSAYAAELVRMTDGGDHAA